MRGSIMAKKVLIVDDEEGIRDALEFFLDREGYETLIASTGEAVKTIISEQIPDLIILDILMPGMNGYELCEQIRDNPITHSIPILMLTGLANTKDELRGYNCGADDYLRKPFNTDELLLKVKKLLK